MKDCPKCGTVYTDDTLSFCLSDGTQLVLQGNDIKTEKFSNLVVDISPENSIEQETVVTNLPVEDTVLKNTKKTEKKGVSPLWIIASIGLFIILILCGLVLWLFSYQIFNQKVAVKNTNQTTKSTNTAKTTPTQQTTPTPKIVSYKVFGVRSDDVLYIRPQAGKLKKFVGKIPSNGSGIKIIGKTKKVGKSRWVLISYNGKKGWINSKYIRKE